MEVADVAGDEEGHDLALPVGKRLVAACEALEDQVHLVRPVALADEILARADLAHVGDRLLDGRRSSADSSAPRASFRISGLSMVPRLMFNIS